MPSSITLETFRQRWDNGAKWYQLESASNGNIGAAELEHGGTGAELARDFAALSPRDQRVALGMFKEPAARTLLEQALSPVDAAIYAGIDRDRNFVVDDKELAVAGFLDKFAQLGPEARRRYILTLKREHLASATVLALAQRFPELFDDKNFVASQFTRPADAERATKTRAFLRNTLRLDVEGVTEGLQLSHLRAFPVRAVPATPEEAFVEQLRTRLADGRAMGLLELASFIETHPFAPPTVAAGDLVKAVAAEPKRFEGKQLRVVGHAEELSQRRYSGLTWGPKYDVLEGKIVFGWQTTSIAETKHKLYTGTNRKDWLLVYQRDEASSFVTVGWIGLGSASTKPMKDKTYTVDGYLRLTSEGPRLTVRDIKTKD